MHKPVNAIIVVVLVLLLAAAVFAVISGMGKNRRDREAYSRSDPAAGDSPDRNPPLTRTRFYWGKPDIVVPEEKKPDGD